VSKFGESTLSHLEYEAVSEETLQKLTGYLDTLPDWLDTHPSYDISYAMGVLTAQISPEVGTYVINKQAPNRQIWLSSPISGPKRCSIIFWIFIENF
jgi:frataxin